MNTTIVGESIQEVYNWYKKNYLIVNRKYQRKLVWTLAEKSKLIDTIRSEYPIPLFLFADIDSKKEIIDGMQRLNAIFDFIENKVSLNGEYFNLDTLARTKELKDNGELIQNTPVLSREICSELSNYKLAISVYKEGQNDTKINEIFSRINSFGRKLSRQEIRQVGLIGGFIDVVNDIASKIRGDVSHGNIIELNNMSKISINIDGSGNNGINVDNIYWCTSNILTKNNIRESEDEAFIANILIEIITNIGYRISNDDLDLSYGKSLKDQHEKAEKRFQDVNASLNAYGSEKLTEEFIIIYDQIKNLNLIINSKRGYIVLFLVLHNLLYKEHYIIKDNVQLVQTAQKVLLKNLNTTQGGTWAKENIFTNFNILKGAILPFFEPSENQIVNTLKITEIKNLIAISETENTYYDFKQGFHNLNEENLFNDSLFKRVMETICAIANTKKDEKGFVLIGVSDNESDKDRSELIYGENGKSYQVNKFFITGLNGESTKYSTKEDYFKFISDKLNNELANNFEGLKSCTIEAVNYYDRYLFLITIETGSAPTLYNQELFYRSGASTKTANVPESIKIAARFN